tara:strand:- start:1599 stop:2054 length:456 start_codon:yes stop_codon:yes gene_type:complete
MTNFHYLKLFKYIAIVLVIYNIITLLVLLLPYKNFKYSAWKLTPYDYSFLTGYPNNLENLSILNSTNRDELRKILNKNISKNILNVDFWNYKLRVENYTKNQRKDFERSFSNLFLLTKNSKNKNFDLQKYFVSNYNYFSEENIKIILENFN